MHLWTEYEGRTVAGAYTLGKLLRSEGRNGFFATSNSTGDSAVIRLTESHFDEEEVLKRWRQVADLRQDNLVGIERMGKTTFDGVALTYALMERNDANLEDVLKERPLTTAETIEVAKSVAAALSALHAGGLVHEHVEPVNVLAVGDVVKLRSDCVRECVADGEFTSEEACDELRKRDVHDFGTLLLRCLTLEKEMTTAHRLAEPFSRVIPAALDGSWNLAKIESVLTPSFSTPKTAAASPSAAASARAAMGAAPSTSGRAPLSANGAGSSPAAAVPLAAEATRVRAEAPIHVRARQAAELEEPVRTGPSRNVLLLGAAALVLVALLCWHFFAGKPTSPTPASPAVVAAPPPQPAAPAHDRGIPAAPAAAAASDASQPAVGTARGASGWYVIAFTYNHEAQARAKAERLDARHSGLHAAVFSPNGRAPYLVSLGGPMSSDDARETLRRARRSGIPRDTFVRKY